MPLKFNLLFFLRELCVALTIDRVNTTIIICMLIVDLIDIESCYEDNLQLLVFLR